MNTDQTPLCENFLGPVDYKEKITEPRGYFSKTTACYNPLFFKEIKGQISKYSPEIVVFFTENSLPSGTWFHSDFLPYKMSRVIDPITKKSLRYVL